MITAPFNFVPLSEKVFFPDWASDVSHDVPFEDAQSGTIDITMTAKSPIFVRDGADEQGFCNHKGTPFIPASSVKGMVRNVLEIMSFSKMSMFNDDTYAVRDLRNRELYMSKMTPDNTFCGWLKKSDEGYVIEDCGKPGRIKHNEIDKIFNMDFASKFRAGKFANKAKDKTAKVKYEMIKSNNFEHGFEYFKKDVNREIYRYDANSNKKGTLVLTGQPSARKEPQGQKPSGKVYEFVFFESKGELKLTKDTYQNFLFAYFDGRKTEPKESPDWAFWKKKLEAGERVPVFFQKNGKEVAHFGLSYLYKLPYTHSVKDGVPPAHNDSRRDLAETMFGYIGKEEALKGRVQFSHFKASSHAQSLAPRTEILGTPRASYYPMYVKQQEGKLFTTFMDGGFNISGWKRYPIHKNGVQKTTDTGNENVGTTFSPLKEGVVFQGKVRYHNLKKAELGALLSALTFHNTKGCFHNIGMAKSLGYGKVELKIDGIALEEYLKAFEVEVSEQVGEWSKSEQIQELLSMATEQENRGNSKLKYMELKGFADHKSKDKDFLRNYTMLEGINCVAPKSLITEADLEALRERQVQRAEEEKLRQEQQKREEQHKKEWEIVYASTNLSTIEAFVSKYPESKYLETAHAKIAEIKEKLLDAEKEEAEAEVKAKWEAVQKVDKKYYKKALEDFIANYGDSTFVSDAKKELESLGGATVSKTTNQGLDFSKADDGKSIERAMKVVQNPSEEDKQKLEEVIKKVYPSLNAKKKKQFAKMKLMVKWLGDDRFNGLLE
jgi:CRISPR-associated protein (TIGR03986 family)